MYQKQEKEVDKLNSYTVSSEKNFQPMRLANIAGRSCACLAE